MNAERYWFDGIDDRGYGRVGDVTVTDLAEWTRKKHAAGWARLRVQHVPTRTDARGHRINVAGVEWPVVAEIKRDDFGVRVWWSE